MVWYAMNLYQFMVVFLPLRVEFTGIVAREKPVNLGQVSQSLSLN